MHWHVCIHPYMQMGRKRRTERAREKESSRPQAFLRMVLQREAIKNRNIWNDKQDVSEKTQPTYQFSGQPRTLCFCSSPTQTCFTSGYNKFQKGSANIESTSLQDFTDGASVPSIPRLDRDIFEHTQIGELKDFGPFGAISSSSVSLLPCWDLPHPAIFPCIGDSIHSAARGLQVPVAEIVLSGEWFRGFGHYPLVHYAVTEYSVQRPFGMPPHLQNETGSPYSFALFKSI